VEKMAKALEYEITRQLLRRREGRASATRAGAGIERLITGVAAVAAVVVLGSVFQELLWALLAAAVVLTLGTGGAR
jgi:hypothetical protein